jgi:hypothetical protein
MTKVYVVRAQNYGNSESFLCGIYPTPALAKVRIATLKGDEYGFSYAWYDEVKVSSTGGDCLL